MSSYKELVTQAAEQLRGVDSVLLLCHDNPDGDTLGSAAALRSALRKLGIRCDMSPGGAVPKRLRFLAEGALYGLCSHETMEGNMTASSLGVCAQSSIKSNSCFQGCSSPYTSPVKYDLIVALDTAERQLLGENEPLAEQIAISIDHHRTSRPYCSGLNLCSPASAATGEIIFDLIEALEVPLDAEIALPLYTALATDTGCFRYSNTTARTFEIAARCAATGIDMARINRQLFELVSRRQLALQGALLKQAVFAADGAVCVAVLTQEMVRDTGATEDDTGGLSGFLRNIEGVEVCALVKESENGSFKISMRSNEKVDVSAVCASFGGGGHIRAAGCRLDGNIDTVVSILLKTLCENL